MTERRFGIVEKIEAEIKKRAGHDLAVDPHMVFRQVPAARPHDKHRRPLAQDIMLARIRVAVIHGAAPAVPQIDLPTDEIVPGRRI